MCASLGSGGIQYIQPDTVYAIRTVKGAINARHMVALSTQQWLILRRGVLGSMRKPTGWRIDNVPGTWNRRLEISVI